MTPYIACCQIEFLRYLFLGCSLCLLLERCSTFKEDMPHIRAGDFVGLGKDLHSQMTSENMATCLLRHWRTALSCTSNTSHCLALKNVEGPTGGPSSGDTTILRLPPTCMLLMPISNPAQPHTSSATSLLMFTPY
jgi:hypothetical protein